MAGKVRNGKKGEAKLLVALAGGATITAAAKSAGIAERTAYRYLENETFRQEVARARAEMISRAVALLAGSACKAAAALRKLLTAESENVRRLAAVSIIDGLYKLRSSDEFETRLQRLEQLLNKESKRT